MNSAGVFRFARIVSVACAATAACLQLSAGPALAQSPAHVSDDLASSRSQGEGVRQTMRVIIHGSAEEVAARLVR
jgi:hypothetical protein